MKKFITLLLFLPLMSIASPLLEAQTDTITWSGNIELNADQFFTQQQTLKVLPGTIVTATGPYKIEIRGNIIAEGTFENPILFTAADTTGLCDSATITGGWHGIHLVNNLNGTGRFNYCNFEYGKANVPGSWYDYQGYHDTLAGNQGGAFRITDFKSIAFSHCTFSYNYSRTSGGAVYFKNVNSIEITACNFLHNKTIMNGGGVYSNNYDSILIANTSFRNNIASHVNTSQGSAMYLYKHPGNSVTIIKDNTFFNNSSLTTVFLTVPSAMVYNNILSNNYGRYNLFFSKRESAAYVFNNTISNNYFDAGIPGIYSSSDDMHIYNNILWNNFSRVLEDDDLAIDWHHHEPSVLYNLIWEGRAPGKYVITEDPLFVNPAPGYGLDYNGWEYDWSLLDDSPAINTGTPDTTGLHLPAFDLAGNPRVFGRRVDIGAYENQHVYVKINDSPVFNTIKLYPNPGNERMVIEILPGMECAEIEIVDGQGKMCMHEVIRHSPMVLFPDKLAAGIYFYRIYNQTGILQSGKWVKR